MAEVIYPKAIASGGGDGKFHLVKKSGERYDFSLKRNQVKVEPKDWQTRLDEKEKLQIFEAILQEYRKRSMGDGGMKIASIGISEDSDIYIATNTERLSSPYFRQCAELNMVTAMTQNEIYHELKKGNTNPHPPKLKALYLLGGQDSDVMKRPICPCGNCTDMLSSVMEPDAPIYMLPVNNAGVEPNKFARTIDEVVPGQVWKTTIATLNAHREINLKQFAAAEQRSGLRSLIKNGTKLPEEQASQLVEHMIGKSEGKAHNVTDLVGILLCNPLMSLPTELMREGSIAIATMVKSAENALLKRDSVAALDAAVENGQLHTSKLNHFMVEQIRGCFADRLKAMQGNHGFASLNDKQIEALIRDRVGTVRCVVLQLDDGTFRYALESRTEVDNAAPSAEMSALAAANRSLGNHGVRDVWVMEMAPKDIAAGVIHTSPKEGAERLLKRRTRTGQDVGFHFIPFNPGTTNDDSKINRLTIDIAATKLFPSFFLGVKQAGAMR